MEKGDKECREKKEIKKEMRRWRRERGEGNRYEEKKKEYKCVKKKERKGKG